MGREPDSLKPFAAVWPGRPQPVGALGWRRRQLRAVLRARGSVELCLFDPTGRRELQRIDSSSAPTRSGTATCRKRGRACSTATACTGPTSRRRATASTRTSCCSIRTREASSARCAGATRISATRVGARARRPVVRPARQRARHAQVPGDRTGVHLGRRPAAERAVARHGDLRAARARLHDAASRRAAGAARHLRRARPPRR